MARRSKSSRKILAKETVAVIGVGRVGLPLAIFLADKGHKVIGIDIDKGKIAEVSKGKMPFMESGAQPLLSKYVNKSLFFSTRYSDAADAQIIILTLGTPVDENMNPSLVQIDNALELLSSYFKEGQLLILRSTVSPGTTEYVKSHIEDMGKFTIGKNFFLAFCPERISEGKSLEETADLPQIVGGIDRSSTQKAAVFFKDLKISVNRGDAVSAELAKLFTNMYRYINFAIANEFMILAGNHNRDIYKVVDLVNKGYKRGGLALPGLTGGPCLFKDGFFLIPEIPFSDLIVTSWKINESIPLFLINQIRKRRKLKGKKAVILGLAFKSEIDDIRESLAFKVKKALERERAIVSLHDPYVPGYQNDMNETLKDADFIFVATNHEIYKKMNITKIRKLVSKNCVICDVWNIFKTDKIIFTINSLGDSISKKRNEDQGEEFEHIWQNI